MPNRSKEKGNRFERYIVSLCEQSDIPAKRSWGSDGRSLGLSEDVDLVANKGNKKYLIQAKRRKSIPNWLQFGNCNLVMTREDRGETIVLIKLKDIINETR